MACLLKDVRRCIYNLKSNTGVWFSSVFHNCLLTPFFDGQSKPSTSLKKTITLSRCMYIFCMLYNHKRKFPDFWTPKGLLCALGPFWFSIFTFVTPSNSESFNNWWLALHFQHFSHLLTETKLRCIPTALHGGVPTPPQFSLAIMRL